jgi:hypothetical protein
LQITQIIWTSMVYLNTFDDDSKQFKLNVWLYQIVQTKQEGCSCLLMHFKSISFHKLTTSSHKLIWLITQPRLLRWVIVILLAIKHVGTLFHAYTKMTKNWESYNWEPSRICQVMTFKISRTQWIFENIFNLRI